MYYYFILYFLSIYRDVENRLLKPCRTSTHAATQLFERVRLIKEQREKKNTKIKYPLSARSETSEPAEESDAFDCSECLSPRPPVSEKLSLVRERRTSINEIANAKLIAKVKESEQQANRRVAMLKSSRKKTSKPSPGAVWKSIFLTLLIVNRMRAYIDLRKEGEHSIAAQ